MATAESVGKLNIFKGIIPPMITPLKDQNTLDLNGLETLIEHILAGGVHGLFILGTTGEGPSLSYKIRYELVERVCKQVKARVPIFVGITDPAFNESVNLAKFAADKGADVLVAAPPFYFSASQTELLTYFEHLARAVSLPLFLYNMPGCTKIMIEPQTVRKAADIEGVAGIKDSSGDMIYLNKLQQLMADRPDFPLFIGPEEMLAQFILLGGKGGVSAGANIFPKLYVDIYKAASAGNVELCTKLQYKVVKISSTIYSMTPGNSSCLKGLKCSLGLMGICSDFVAEPFHRFNELQRETIKKVLNEFDLI